MSEQIKISKLEGITFNKKNCLINNFIEKTEDPILYSNLYPIKFNRDIEICEYPFKIEPEVHEENIILKILRQASKELFQIYGYYYRSGDSFFATKKIEEDKQFHIEIIKGGKIEYTLFVNKNANHTIIKAGQTKNFSEIEERMIYLILREILSANPFVHFDRDNLYLENMKKKVVNKNNNSIYNVHDGYKISIQQADDGIYLAIGVKNKIKGQFTIYDFLKKKENLKGRKFIPNEGSRHQVIHGFNIDKNPMNTEIKYKNESITLFQYYKKYFKIEIKDKYQPLIEVKFKEKIKYYVPELCTLIELNEEDARNHTFMAKIIEKTRLNPDPKIEQIEKCIDLFYDETLKKSYNTKDSEKTLENKEDKKIKENKENLNTINNDENNSSNKKRKYYGIEIIKNNKTIRPYYITQPTFTNGENDNLTINDINRVIPVIRDELRTNQWICLYPSYAEKITYNLLKGFKNCIKGYGMEFKNVNSNWIPMKNSFENEWIKTVESELKNRKECKFVIFIIDDDDLYRKLKKHSLSTKGYISQVIKLGSFYKMNKPDKGKRWYDSYLSKILLQINNKIGGFNYFLNTDSFIDERKIMLLGIDSSHIWGDIKDQRTGIAMVSTKDINFSKFYTREEILKPDEHYASETRRVIHAFIKDAYQKYNKENKCPPKNIIIYRQGIAHNQLKFVELEVQLIEQTCQEYNLNYYYVIVNTSTFIKFFEFNCVKDRINKGKFKNPEQGLVILDQITNKKRFEFYIQPQKVNIGSATPTYFHVAYGTMNFPELLIQLTYWTTYLYSNWQNAVRVPHVIKMAEKLAYMTAKFTHSELNSKLSDNNHSFNN